MESPQEENAMYAARRKDEKIKQSCEISCTYCNKKNEWCAYILYHDPYEMHTDWT